MSPSFCELCTDLRFQIIQCANNTRALYKLRSIIYLLFDAWSFCVPSVAEVSDPWTEYSDDGRELVTLALLRENLFFVMPSTGWKGRSERFVFFIFESSLCANQALNPGYQFERL